MKQVRQVLAGEAASGQVANGVANGSANRSSNGAPNGLVNGNGQSKGDAAIPPFTAVAGLRGVYNMGATCYMAVILQSMVHNPILKGFFLAGGHESGECKREWCVMCCVDRLFCEFFSSPQVSGYGIADLLTATAKSDKPMMTGSTQQDAHEFLQFLLDEFHKAHFVSTTFSHATEVAGGGSNATTCPCPAHRAFGGTIESTLACECTYETKTFEPIMDLSLELTGRSLRTCLDRFTAGEKLSHYTCSACKQTGTVTKRLMVEKLPPVLQIQLKRFKHTVDGAAQKLESPIEFPFQLDVTPYTTNPGGRPLLYELYGVICHQGSLDTGHYTCMMKHSSGAWYHFNDDMVTKVSPKNVVSLNAYLLFYIVKYTL